MVADVSDIDSAAGKRDSNRRNLWKSRREQERAEPRWIVERGDFRNYESPVFHAPLPGGLVGRQPDTADSDRITTSFEILYTAEGGIATIPPPPLALEAENWRIVPGSGDDIEQRGRQTRSRGIRGERIHGLRQEREQARSARLERVE